MKKIVLSLILMANACNIMGMRTGLKALSALRPSSKTLDSVRMLGHSTAVTFRVDKSEEYQERKLCDKIAKLPKFEEAKDFDHQLNLLSRYCGLGREKCLAKTHKLNQVEAKLIAGLVNKAEDEFNKKRFSSEEKAMIASAKNMNVKKGILGASAFVLGCYADLHDTVPFIDTFLQSGTIYLPLLYTGWNIMSFNFFNKASKWENKLDEVQGTMNEIKTALSENPNYKQNLPL